MNKKLTAEKLDAAGKCIACEEAAENRTRGLCTRDYQRYRRAWERLDDSDREQFDAELIEQGLLLPSRQGSRGVPGDKFADALNAFLASKEDVDPKDAEEALKRAQAAEKLTPQQLAEHALDVARQATKAKKATKKRETKT